MVQPPHEALGVIAILFVPVVALFGSRVILHASPFVTSRDVVNRYALLTGGASVASILPAGLLIHHILPSRSILVYRGEATEPYGDTYALTSLQPEVRDAVYDALNSGVATIASDGTISRKFTVVNDPLAYEFAIITEVVVFGYSVNKITAILVCMTIFTALVGSIVISYLYLRAPDERAT